MSENLENARDNLLSSLLQSKFEKITPETLAEFLYLKGIQVVRCLMCGSEDMGIPQATIDKYENGEITYVSPVKIDTDGPRFSLMNYEYRIICKNCGFVSHFSAWPVIDWATKKPRKGGDDER